MTVHILSVPALGRASSGLQVVDARTRAAFEAGHIPGAVWMGWEEWCDPAPAPHGSILREAGYWGVLRAAPEWWYAERLSATGVRLDEPIAVYSSGPRCRGREGRIAWMLLYLGACDVSLLDGGLPAWRAAGGSVEIAPTRPTGRTGAVPFQPHRRRAVTRIAAEWSDGRRPLFVDTRSSEEFDGGMQDYLPRRGRLPGAVLLPFASLYDGAGRYVDRDTYLRLLPPGVITGEDVVAYCEVGVRAGVCALLHEVYTGAVMPVCDGSLVEWAVQSRLPLESGDSGSPPVTIPSRLKAHSS